MIINGTLSGMYFAHRVLSIADRHSGFSDKNLTSEMNSVNKGVLFENNPIQTPGSGVGVVPYNHGEPIGLGVSENIAAGAYASSANPEQRLGWYFGGVAHPDYSALSWTYFNDNIVASGTFYRIDMSDSEHAHFTSLKWPEAQAPRAEGGLVWLPFGEEGILVALGGVITPPDLYVVAPKALPNNNTFMTDLAIYDIHGDKWYSQSTLESSPGPPQLAKFCTAVVPTEDGCSQEIFVYGGYDGTGESSTPENDDVWVLSVPAFEWTLVKEAEKGSTHGRSGNICFAPNPTTMITVGGSLWAGGSLRSNTLVDIFNLSSLEWDGNYDASSSASLSAPPAVVQQLNWPSPRGPGGITVSNLADPDLNDLFNTPYPTKIKSNYPYATETPKIDTEDGHHNTNKWKIPVIATLCSVLPALMIAAIAICCFRRYRKNKQGDERTQQSRRNVFSWLGKPSHVDPEPEKSNASDNTAVESNPDYFNQPGYKTAKEVVYEAPSNVTSPGWNEYGHGSPGLTGVTATPQHERHEIMDQPQRESMSIRNHPYYPRSIAGNHIRSVRSESLSQPSELVSSPRTTAVQTSPSELPQDKSNENLPQAPNDMKPDQNEGGEAFPSTGMAPGSAIPRKPVGERRVSSPDPWSASPRPGHKRNQSSISSDIPILPSPEPKEDWRRSRQIEALPDVPTSAHRQTTTNESGRVSAYCETFDEATDRQ